MPRDGFSHHTAEIGSQREVAAFIELRLVQPRPLTVHLAALHWASHNEHHIGVAAISPAVHVFARRAPDLGHRNEDGVLNESAEIDPELTERLRKLAENVGD